MRMYKIWLRRLSRILVGGSMAGMFGLVGTARAADTTPPPTALLPRVIEVTASSVILNWTPGYITEPTRWRVYENGVLVKTTYSSSYTALNLIPGGTYSYFLVSVDLAGNASAPTRTMTVTTRGPGVLPGAPSNLRVRELAPGRVGLVWTEPDDNFDVASYQISEGAVQVGQARPTWNGEATAVIRNLTPGSSHSYTVRAIRSSPSTPSNAVTVVTPLTNDSQPPQVPTGVTVTTSRYSCNFVDLTWNPSLDNVDSQAEVDYEITVNGVLDHVIRGAGFSGNIFGGGPGETKTYSVRAVDSSGNASAPSQTLSFSIDPRCVEF
jgi:hypothetical protein